MGLFPQTVEKIRNDIGSSTGDALTSLRAKFGDLPATLTAILGNPTGDTLTSLAAKLGNNAQSFAAWSGDMSGHTFTSMAAKWGNMTETLLVVLGARADATVQTTADASMHARLKGMLTSLGNPSADTLVSITAKWGNIARSLTTILGTRWDVAGDLGTDIGNILAGGGSSNDLTGTVDAGSTASSIVDAARTEATADLFVGRTFIMESGTRLGEVSEVVDFDPATDTLLIWPALTGAPTAGDNYRIVSHNSQFGRLANTNGQSGFDGSTDSLQALRDRVDTLIGTPAGASVSADLLVIDDFVDALETAVGAIEGATTLHNKLTAARAALLDQITAARLAELDAANLPADVDTLLARLTALRAGYIDNLSAGAVALASVATEARLAELDAANLPADVSAILADTGTDGVVVNSRTTAYGRAVGVTQVLEVSVTSAANAGDVTLATITAQPCLIKSLVVHADTASQADLTSAAVAGGASKVVVFLSATDAAVANLNAVDEQVAWTGAVRLAAAKTIVMTLAGTGATAVDLTVTIEYEACVAGGYLA